MAAEMLLNTPYVDQFVICQSLPFFYWSKMIRHYLDSFYNSL